MKDNNMHYDLIASLDLEPLFRGHWSKFRGKFRECLLKVEMDDGGRKVWGWGASFKVFNVIIIRHGNPMCSDDTATAAFNPVYQAHLGLIMERMSKKKKKIIYNIANGHGWMAHENTNPTRLCGNIWRAGDTASNVVRNSFVTTRNWNVSFSNSSHGFSSASLPSQAHLMSIDQCVKMVKIASYVFFLNVILHFSLHQPF